MSQQLKRPSRSPPRRASHRHLHRRRPRRRRPPPLSRRGSGVGTSSNRAPISLVRTRSGPSTRAPRRRRLPSIRARRRGRSACMPTSGTGRCARVRASLRECRERRRQLRHRPPPRPPLRGSKASLGRMRGGPSPPRRRSRLLSTRTLRRALSVSSQTSGMLSGRHPPRAHPPVPPRPPPPPRNPPHRRRRVQPHLFRRAPTSPASTPSGQSTRAPTRTRSPETLRAPAA